MGNPLRSLVAVMMLSLAAGCAHEPKAKSPNADLSDPACKFAQVSGHPDPERLIKDYAEHEVHGKLFTREEWLSGASTCPAAEVKPERFAIVTSYNIVRLASTPTTAEYLLEFQGKGGIKYNAEGGTWEWDFFKVKPDAQQVSLVKTEFGWRIVKPAVGADSYLLTDAAKAMTGKKLKSFFKKYGPSEK